MDEILHYPQLRGALWLKIQDQRFGSCAGLRRLFSPVSPDMAVVQLSTGPLEGRLRVYSLGAYRVAILNHTQNLFLTGTRRPKPCTISIPLSAPHTNFPIRAQGKTMPWSGVMGYNQKLRDFDLLLPANTTLATIIIDKDQLLKHHSQQKRSSLALERWETTNQLELKEPNRSLLYNYLSSLIDQKVSSNQPNIADSILTTVMDSFNDDEAETRYIARREARHEAAIELLHWFTQYPGQRVTADELSRKLFQSRTSLFKGCQEHFGRSPLDLQRLIRLDLVRQLLLNPERCKELGLSGVGAIAAHLGFSSRSHFARRYQEQYEELPQNTLSQSMLCPS